MIFKESNSITKSTVSFIALYFQFLKIRSSFFHYFQVITVGSFLPVNFGSWEICKATSIQGANISPVILKEINLSLISRKKPNFRKNFTCTFQLIAFVCFISIYVHSDSSSRTTYFQ